MICGEALDEPGLSQETVGGQEHGDIPREKIPSEGKADEIISSPGTTYSPENRSQDSGTAQSTDLNRMGYASTINQQPASTSKRAWRKPLIIGLSILLIAGLAVGGVFIYLKVTESSRMLSQARGLCEDGDYTRSMEICDEIMQRWPDSSQAEEAKALKPEAYILYGEKLVEEASMDCYSGAETVFNDLMNEDYSDAERLENDRYNLYVCWARACNSEGMLTEELANYDKAAQIRALSEEEHNAQSMCLSNLGEQAKNQGNYGEAADFFERCYFESPEGQLAGYAKANWIDMVVARETGAVPPSKDPNAPGTADLVIENNTDETARVFFSGPTSDYFDVPAHQAMTVNLLRGYYNIITCFPDSNEWLWPEVNEEYTMDTSQGYYTKTFFYE